MVDTERLSPLQPGDWEWQKNAACRAMGTAVFFHPTDERDPARSQRIARAQAICHSCAVIIDCLAYALRVREPYGTLGRPLRKRPRLTTGPAITAIPGTCPAVRYRESICGSTGGHDPEVRVGGRRC